ncbi:MAG: ammonium transporter [Ruminococcus bromii]|nr:ammonium transporter [Ruminococcus bromii]MCI7210997.1 ammonium transporter [Ruminococcus bromii]MDD6434040.1 ammonium transporter [Ruminococcus bromii]MDY4084844.1 ammonium transporter [Ruminococcus bromii]
MSELIFGSTGVWFMIGALLVFFMQCGFAMVETGFTRAKNAGNIIMKNLLDFCIGTVVFSVLGFGLMMSEDYVVGFIGIPNLNMFTDWANFDWNSFVFQLVFCATAATIVSGSMAERTKFSAYCVYSAVISLVIYPIEAGWMWNSQGWLAQLGAIDFAGSIVIHMVGGVTALIGAMILGPRIGKYGKDGKVNAIPGHSITLGALGVFILWFAWYGFNGAAAEDGARLGQILLTTTIAPAVATITTMIFTWVKNGKPDVSMSLNGSLAGLVAVTAGCADVDAIGSAVIGLVSGIIVVLAVEFVDIKLRIDDPVGAFAVHGVNGFWGGLAVGLFATGEGQNGITGLFYGGGLAQLGKQALAILCIIAWTVVCMTIVFFIIKKTIGLRVTKEEEMQGLDISEHGLVSAYADFMPIGVSTASLDETFDVQGNVPVTQAVPVQLAGKYDVATDGVKITKIDIILKQSKLEALKEEMDKLGITGMTVSQVLGCGAQKGKPEYYRGVAVESNLLPKMKVEVVVCKVPVKDVVDAAVKALYTGHIGDGKIFIYNVEDVVKVRTGETGYDAMQDVE